MSIQVPLVGTRRRRVAWVSALTVVVMGSACATAETPRRAVTGINACSERDAEEARTLSRAAAPREGSPHRFDDFSYSVAQRAEIFAPCYQAFQSAIEVRPAAVLLRLEVSPSGEADACVADANTNHPAFLDCVVGAVHTLAFRTVSSTVTTVFPFLMKAS